MTFARRHPNHPRYLPRSRRAPGRGLLSSVSLALAIALACASGLAGAQSLPMDAQGHGSFRIELEGLLVDTTVNSVRKGEDFSGTRFNAIDYTGSHGVQERASLYLPGPAWVADDELRVVIAPYLRTGTAPSTNALVFDGARFAPGPLTVAFKFSTYRLTYDVPVHASPYLDAWELRLGGTLAIRDARVELEQAGLKRNFYNWGPVPLLYASVARTLAPHWRLAASLDAFPAPGGGGLFDGSVTLGFNLTRNATLYAGGRYVSGGAAGAAFYDYLRQRALVAGVSIGF